ncbi:nucleotidyltransferase domain-containing protein [Goodfellowiella coeruleoviolacea]|uniref:2''-aminoglycoside nucleotidyltransferase n=1 Tax=Goodfellowiella coeruleoviolacea TaxID=334858 RepID=A0AAE3GG59_9PSEU|nr:hypothetical protein [Goodfellowiella coeruleoviolacea]MCP2166740.1 2''-aminoglycoside nucleotidyltransferase [Goodfellowiella coeruleoviolacea]
MTAATVLRVLELLRAADVAVWIAGGWGIDALVGRQTRTHEDLDLLHNVEHEDRAVQVLADNGFRLTLDLRPVRFVLTGPGAAQLDLHPLAFAPDGSAVQAADDAGGTFDYPAECFVTGRIGRTEVPCVSTAQQIHFHQGYQPRARDLHDMAQLRAAFGVSTHF